MKKWRESFEVKAEAIRAAVRFLDETDYLRETERFLYDRNVRRREALLDGIEFGLSEGLLRDRAKSNSIILHSLPRMDELPTDVDATRHARYWVEAFNGVVMRMALLASVLGAME